MIPCPKCGAQNQIGAIFCRGCGEKLNLEELKPEKVKAAAKKQVGSNFNVFALIKNLIMLGILLGLLGVLAGLFLTPSMPSVDVTDKARRSAAIKLKQYQQGLIRGMTLTEAEVNAMAEDIFELTPKGIEKTKEEALAAGESKMMAVGITVDLLDDNRIKIILKQQHIKRDFIRYYSVIIGKVAVKNGHLTFEPEEAYQGKIPLSMADYTFDIVKERFHTFYRENQVFTSLIGSIKSIKITDNKLVLSGGMRPQAVAPVNGNSSPRRRRRRR
ncbi:MAG: zinc ribbon domain-containing protein [Lentisphaerae bacterium]|nr:MAG: zinc ribbon domain-containing protein [Lentisphaerota bacterium]